MSGTMYFLYAPFSLLPVTMNLNVSEQGTVLHEFWGISPPFWCVRLDLYLHIFKLLTSYFVLVCSSSLSCMFLINARGSLFSHLLKHSLY